MTTAQVLVRLEELFKEEVRQKNNYGYKEVQNMFDGCMKIVTREYMEYLETKAKSNEITDTLFDSLKKTD